MALRARRLCRRLDGRPAVLLDSYLLIIAVRLGLTVLSRALFWLLILVLGIAILIVGLTVLKLAGSTMTNLGLSSGILSARVLSIARACRRSLGSLGLRTLELSPIRVHSLRLADWCLAASRMHTLRLSVVRLSYHGTDV